MSEHRERIGQLTAAKPHGAAERSAADRGPAERGEAERGAADRGPAERSAADRGPAERGAADRGPAERGAATRDDLADRQVALVAALVVGAPVPGGFDVRLVGIARQALLRKRAGDVARYWPLLAAGLGPRWTETFATWAATRPTMGSLRDGWDLARSLAATGRLPDSAAEELAVREARWRYDGQAQPRARRLPAVRRAGRTVGVQLGGRIRLVRLSRRAR